ncbi:U3 small nucleolar RNA-interacting protein 2-like [Pocillopora damicornis]|uniref:U3 small nucleolar RNA-interacting protein 2-like n=1 Tax=Pocillopora damicornis TaxID=46731 RepID=UPI000F54EE4C|nr:U3 small nucleolar RNA-interacting protein 2-like [Pocillopora damicornis]
MSGFFLSDSKGSASKPRKRQAKSSQISGFRNKKQRGKQSLSKAEHIDEDEFGSDSDVPSDKEEDIPGEEESSDHETAQEKRLRLAKQYLAQLEKEEQEKKESDDIDHDAIAHRLKQDVLEQTGKFQKRVASQYTQPSPAGIRVLKGHQLSVTCLCVSPDDKFVFSASKDCSIIKWNIETGLKEGKILGCHKASEGSKGHKGHVLCLAVTSDGKFLASGGRDKIIHIWDPDSLQHVHTFKGHKDAVSGLAFRRGTHHSNSSLSLWSVSKKKPLCTIPNAHSKPDGNSDDSIPDESWITSIASLRSTDLLASGSCDSCIKLWECGDGFRSLKQLFSVSMVGFVNALAFSNDGNNLIAGIGQEHRLGRWWRLKKAKNCVCVIPLQRTVQNGVHA